MEHGLITKLGKESFSYFVLKDIQINLLTINTPVRDDYQLSKDATARVNHINIYDEKDHVQSRGGSYFIVLPDLPNTPDFMRINTKGTEEYGEAGRMFENAKNIKVNNPHNLFNDFHNSHNRVYDWYFKLPVYENKK